MLLVGLKCIKTRSAVTLLSNNWSCHQSPRCTSLYEKYHALTHSAPPSPNPPPRDNDMEVTGEQPQGAEWQSISWLPFHLNTSIKAHCGWVSGVAPLHDSDSLGFMQREKLNVYSSGDKLNPGLDTLAVKKYSVSGALHYKSLLPPIIPQHHSYSFGFTDIMPLDHWEPVANK